MIREYEICTTKIRKSGRSNWDKGWAKDSDFIFSLKEKDRMFNNLEIKELEIRFVSVVITQSK